MATEAGSSLEASASSSAMETLMGQVRGMSRSAGFPELVVLLSKSVDSTLVKMDAAVVSTALDTLDNQEHSLGVLALLLSRLRRGDDDNLDALVQRFVVFVSQCNPEQLGFWPSAVFELVALLTSRFVDGSVCCAKKLALMHLLLTLLPKVQSHNLQLTPIHADVVRLSLSSRYFGAPVLDLLALDFVDLHKECCGDNGRAVLLFFYYGGLVLTAVKRLERALFCFEVVVTVPAVAVSHIMLEAHKKFLLLSLLVHGYKASFKASLPKYTSHVVEKHFRHLCLPYYDLVSAFCTSDNAKLQSTAERHSAVFVEDKNAGLVKQVLRMHVKANVQRLTRTFVTLTLNEMATRVGLASVEEAEKLLVDMIDERSIDAKIDRSSDDSQVKMVRFDTSAHCSYDSVPALKHIEESVLKCMRLNEQIKAMDEEIQLHPGYVKKMLVVTGAIQSQDEEAGGRGVSNMAASSTANGGVFN